MAPQVTEIKVGCKGFKFPIARYSWASASSVFGGKNSNERSKKVEDGRMLRPL